MQLVRPTRPTMWLITQYVADYYQMPISKIMSSDQHQEFVRCRTMIALISRFYKYKFIEIAQHLKRDTSTIIQNNKSYKSQMKIYTCERNKYQIIIDEIERKVRECEINRQIFESKMKEYI